jgi:fission 1 protein
MDSELDRLSDIFLEINSSLSPAELSVLRAQYEKEEDMVGVQTKFNYAWVRLVCFGFTSPASYV